MGCVLVEENKLFLQLEEKENIEDLAEKTRGQSFGLRGGLPLLRRYRGA
jgi:hypothetical protein